MGKKSEGKLIFILLLSIILLTAIVSAGLFDWLKETITGKALSQPTNMSITVAGLNTVSIRVWNETLTGSAVQPSEWGATSGITAIAFNVTVTDIDGVNDINDSSVVVVNFVAPALGTTRTNTTVCPKNSGQGNSTSSNFTCVVSLFYFDPPGNWQINVTANDYGNQFYNSSAKNFSYSTLQSLVTSPPTVYWPTISPAATNKTSNQNTNYTTINNTGNFNITPGNISVNAIDVFGPAGYNISASSFRASNYTGGSGCSGTCPECGLVSSVALINNTYVNVTNASMPYGNLSLGGGIGQEQVYYCIPLVPNVQSGPYNTTQGGSWSVKMNT